MGSELASIGSSILLFFLVFGMSATVDMKHMKRQIRNRNALLTGISLQFIILPLLGFAVVKLMRMSAPMGITLLVVTSSPGGSYSNWYEYTTRLFLCCIMLIVIIVAIVIVVFVVVIIVVVGISECIVLLLLYYCTHPICVSIYLCICIHDL